MMKLFEVLHKNPETFEDRSYGLYDSLDMALETIKKNWSFEGWEEVRIIERISDFNVVDKDEKVDPCYGLEKLTMTIRDLNALLNGKKLYTTINGDEYAIEIDYSGNKENKK